MYSAAVILINVEGVTRDYVVDLLISRPDCGKESSLIFSAARAAALFITRQPPEKSDDGCCALTFLLFHNKKFEKCLYCFGGALLASAIYLFLFLSPFAFLPPKCCSVHHTAEPGVHFKSGWYALHARMDGYFFAPRIMNRNKNEKCR